MAHVFFETGDPDGGSDFLGDWLDGYDRRGPFNVHLSWHQALFQLATGRPENAVSLYEDHIRPTVVKKNLGSLQDAASLMWRMKIYGDGEPEGSWNEVLEIARPAAEKPGPAFRDAHAALTFAAGGHTEEMGKLISGLDAMAGEGNALSREVMLPLAKGVEAFANGAYEDAADNLDGLVDQLSRIGGSHAQREVFEDTILESYIRSGRFDKAQDLLNTRLKRRTSVRDEVWLGRTDGGGCGLGKEREMTSQAVRDKVADLVRQDLEGRVGDKLKFDPILVFDRVDHDDDDYLDIIVVYDGDRKHLDPDTTIGLVDRITPQLLELGTPWPPSRSFVERSEWEEDKIPWYHEPDWPD